MCIAATAVAAATNKIAEFSKSEHLFTYGFVAYENIERTGTMCLFKVVHFVVLMLFVVSRFQFGRRGWLGVV